MSLEESSRREFVQLFVPLLSGGLVAAALSSFLPNYSDAAPRARVQNLLVLNMEGKVRDYKEPAAPIYNAPLEEIVKDLPHYRSGIGNYLAWPGNPRAGKPALLSFGSYHCAPCGANMPHLEQIYRKYPSLQVIGLNSFDGIEDLQETIKKTKEKLAEHKVSYPNLMMFQTQMNQLLLDFVPAESVYPQILLVNSAREVVHITKYLFEIGEGKKPSRDIDRLYQEIEKILPRGK